MLLIRSESLRSAEDFFSFFFKYYSLTVAVTSKTEQYLCQHWKEEKKRLKTQKVNS